MTTVLSTEETLGARRPTLLLLSAAIAGLIGLFCVFSPSGSTRIVIHLNLEPDAPLPGLVPPCNSKPIPPLRDHTDLRKVLEQEGFRRGAELGVQRGDYADALHYWHSCERYYLIDTGGDQGTTGTSNPLQSVDEVPLLNNMQTLLPYPRNTVFLRRFVSDAYTEIKEEELDFLYIHARHEYLSYKKDIERFWGKLRSGGIMAGSHYFNSDESVAEDLTASCYGSKEVGASRGVVDEFARRHGLQLVVSYRDNCRTWAVRKS